MEKTLEECLDDLYLLGQVQGEHNINWSDEYNLLEHSKNYSDRMKAIAQKYGIECAGDFANGDYDFWDKLGFQLHELTKEEILKIVRDRIEISQ